MSLAKRVFRALLYGVCAVALAAGGGILYLQWTGATVGLAGSGTSIVVEHVHTDARLREIEEDRAREAAAAAHPTRDQIAAASPPGEAPETGEPAAESRNYWTEYRGPLRAGKYAEMDLDLNWPPAGPPELWRQQVGGGYASMVVADGLVFTIEQRGNREVVSGYSLSTGHQAWEHSWEARFSERLGGDGPRATPTWSEGRLYALGASGHLVCLSADSGEVLWQRNILSDAGADNVTWGMAAAPLVVDGIVVTLPGGRGDKSVFAYDKLTGEILWSALDDQAAYVAPQVVDLAGRRQLLVVSGTRVLGASLDDGSLLWSVPWDTSSGINCSQPLVIDEDHVFVSSGYGHGAALLKITETDGAFAAEQVWLNRNMKNKFNSSVLDQGVVYGLDEGILAAVDAKTGERLWKQGRFRYGQLLFAQGHLIVVSEEGELALVEAAPDAYRELARFAPLSGKTWNVPAIAGGILLVRNQTELVAYDLRSGRAG